MCVYIVWNNKKNTTMGFFLNMDYPSCNFYSINSYYKRKTYQTNEELLPNQVILLKMVAFQW